MDKYYKGVRRNINPTFMFIMVYALFILAPMSYIVLSDFYSNYWYELSINEYRYSARLALFVSTMFFLCFIFGYLISRISPQKRQHSKSQKLRTQLDVTSKARVIEINSLDGNQVFYALQRHRFFFWMALISIALVWINFAFGGYEKLALFGQDISKLEYRLIGFNDRDRVLTAMLQLARRLTLPFCAIYFLLLNKYSNKYSGWFNAFLVFSLFSGILMTLDRGPFMLMIVMFAYIYYSTAKNLLKIGLYGIVSLVVIVVLGGALSFVQHNIQDFNFDDVLLTGSDFILNRVVMAPNFVPIELSYGIFDVSTDKLWLRYARITAIFTGEYVGTLQDNSLYVGPVGAVADIWRNMGFYGIVPIGILLGLFFAKMEEFLDASDPITCTAASFTLITLVFYFVYGTFFSQGVFLQIAFLYVVLKYVKSDGIMYNK